MIKDMPREIMVMLALALLACVFLAPLIAGLVGGNDALFWIGLLGWGALMVVAALACIALFVQLMREEWKQP